MDREHFRQHVEHLRKQGQSIRTIAAALGVNRGRVERAVKMSAWRRSSRPVQQGESRQSSIFVGRQREMEALRSTLENALSGQGRLVMLGGEPGIGKTRTAQDLANVAAQQGGRVLWGGCYTEHGSMGLIGILNALFKPRAGARSAHGFSERDACRKTGTRRWDCSKRPLAS